jgi:hypothetical protein
MLLNALASKTDLIRNALIINEPDQHGGFELGTWNTDYMKWFSKTMNFPRTESTEHFGDVSIHEQFSVENCQCVVKSINKILKKLKGKTILKTTANNPLNFNHVKWYQRLMEMFSKNDVVWFGR